MIGRVRLRALARGDLALFRALYCDAETMRHIGRPFSHADAAASLRATLVASREAAGPFFCTIIERGNDRAVGLCSIRPTADPRCHELGIMMVRTARGRGLAREALGVLIDAAFRTLPITGVSVQYRCANAAMARVCDGLGFSPARMSQSGARAKTYVRMLRRPRLQMYFEQPAKRKPMSKIIEFLEQAGRDAALRHATREQLLRGMSRVNIGKTLQDAVLNAGSAGLAALIDARETMYCQNQSKTPPKAPAKAPPKKAPPKKKAPAKKAPAKQPARKAPKRKH
ncbi:MAG TPA: GNAT family N-acetyltransferase [Rudaea sp.]|nr:GNAT family N-acetyltransferase [Rudaea sp.]